MTQCASYPQETLQLQSALAQQQQQQLPSQRAFEDSYYRPQWDSDLECISEAVGDGIFAYSSTAARTTPSAEQDDDDDVPSFAISPAPISAPTLSDYYSPLSSSLFSPITLPLLPVFPLQVASPSTTEHHLGPSGQMTTTTTIPEAVDPFSSFAPQDTAGMPLTMSTATSAADYSRALTEQTIQHYLTQSTPASPLSSSTHYPEPSGDYPRGDIIYIDLDDDDDDTNVDECYGGETSSVSPGTIGTNRSPSQRNDCTTSPTTSSSLQDGCNLPDRRGNGSLADANENGYVATTTTGVPASTETLLPTIFQTEIWPWVQSFGKLSEECEMDILYFTLRDVFRAHSFGVMVAPYNIASPNSMTQFNYPMFNTPDVRPDIFPLDQVESWVNVCLFPIISEQARHISLVVWYRSRPTQFFYYDSLARLNESHARTFMAGFFYGRSLGDVHGEHPPMFSGAIQPHLHTTDNVKDHLRATEEDRLSAAAVQHPNGRPAPVQKAQAISMTCVTNVPQQPNGTDCGYYAISFASQIIQRARFGIIEPLLFPSGGAPASGGRTRTSRSSPGYFVPTAIDNAYYMYICRLKLFVYDVWSGAEIAFESVCMLDPALQVHRTLLERVHLFDSFHLEDLSALWRQSRFDVDLATFWLSNDHLAPRGWAFLAFTLPIIECPHLCAPSPMMLLDDVCESILAHLDKSEPFCALLWALNAAVFSMNGRTYAISLGTRNDTAATPSTPGCVTIHRVIERISEIHCATYGSAAPHLSVRLDEDFSHWRFSSDFSRKALLVFCVSVASRCVDTERFKSSLQEYLQHHEDPLMMEIVAQNHPSPSSSSPERMNASGTGFDGPSSGTQECVLKKQARNRVCGTSWVKDLCATIIRSILISAAQFSCSYMCVSRVSETTSDSDASANADATTGTRNGMLEKVPLSALGKRERSNAMSQADEPDPVRWWHNRSLVSGLSAPHRPVRYSVLFDTLNLVEYAEWCRRQQYRASAASRNATQSSKNSTGDPLDSLRHDIEQIDMGAQLEAVPDVRDGQRPRDFVLCNMDCALSDRRFQFLSFMDHTWKVYRSSACPLRFSSAQAVASSEAGTKHVYSHPVLELMAYVERGSLFGRSDADRHWGISDMLVALDQPLQAFRPFPTFVHDVPRPTLATPDEQTGYSDHIVSGALLHISRTAPAVTATGAVLAPIVTAAGTSLPPVPKTTEEISSVVHHWSSLCIYPQFCNPLSSLVRPRSPNLK